MHNYGEVQVQSYVLLVAASQTHLNKYIKKQIIHKLYITFLKERRLLKTTKNRITKEKHSCGSLVQDVSYHYWSNNLFTGSMAIENDLHDERNSSFAVFFIPLCLMVLRVN